jgi:hypothetical protein
VGLAVRAAGAVGAGRPAGGGRRLGAGQRLFLACGLVVQYAVAHRGRPRPDAVALLGPFVVLAGYAVYLTR